MGTAHRDGDILLTWHPDSARILLVLWDLGQYSERRNWCIEGADRGRWDAAPEHGDPVAWMPVPFLWNEDEREVTWRRRPLHIGNVGRPVA